jgi:hypothetical protein
LLLLLSTPRQTILAEDDCTDEYHHYKHVYVSIVLDNNQEYIACNRVV